MLRRIVLDCCALTAFRIQRNQQGVQAMKLIGVFFTSRYATIRKNSFEKTQFANGIILNAFYDEKINFLINILFATGQSVKDEIKGGAWFRFRHTNNHQTILPRLVVHTQACEC